MKKRDVAESIEQIALQAIADEPELPGPIPAELVVHWMTDPAKVLRAVVKETKAGIRDRFRRAILADRKRAKGGKK